MHAADANAEVIEGVSANSNGDVYFSVKNCYPRPNDVSALFVNTAIRDGALYNSRIPYHNISDSENLKIPATLVLSQDDAVQRANNLLLPLLHIYIQYHIQYLLHSICYDSIRIPSIMIRRTKNMSNCQSSCCCDCNHNNQQVVGMAYVPDQQWRKILAIDEGFSRGTIFAELHKPWLVGGSCHE